jgi:catechol 2,3-dioxygenase-like lactoylglutathione lyase family enzyme
MGLYGWLIGDWTMDATIYADDGSRHEARGTIHFGWVLEGRAIQDVWILPGFFHGTTLRVYDPGRDAWHIQWSDPLKQYYARQIGRAQGPDIVQEGRNDAGEATRWRFTDITQHSFCWLGERSTDNGATWELQSRFLARRAIVPAVRAMFDHLSIGVRDLAAAKRFYGASLQPLGYCCLYEDAATLGYGATGPSLWVNTVERPVPPDTKSGLHICVTAPTRGSVDAFHMAALGPAGGTMATRAPVPTTVLDITPRSSSIRMATVSRPIMTGKHGYVRGSLCYAAFRNGSRKARHDDQPLYYTFKPHCL